MDQNFAYVSRFIHMDRFAHTSKFAYTGMQINTHVCKFIHVNGAYDVDFFFLT